MPSSSAPHRSAFKLGNSSSSQTQAYHSATCKNCPVPHSSVVVDTVAVVPLVVLADTPHWIAPGPHSGGAEPSPAPELAVGLAFVLQINKKYGAELLSVPIADQLITSSELVGVDVEDSVTS